jgi:hypothetical protein
MNPVLLCRFCRDEPGLHSFHIQSETDTHVVYHTRVRDARDKKVSQIVEHIELYLSQKPLHKTWEWSMDCTSFHIEWYTFELTMALQSLIHKYRHTITQFRLFNVNRYMKTFVEMCRPFLNSHVKQVLVVE